MDYTLLAVLTLQLLYKILGEEEEIKFAIMFPVFFICLLLRRECAYLNY